MKKSTAAISLVLVGSALTAAIVSSMPEQTPEEENTQNQATSGHHGGGHAGVAVFAASRLLGRGMAGGSSVGVAPSARGGFGTFGGLGAGS